jgi:diacylglycerol kinase (ATP)
LQFSILSIHQKSHQYYEGFHVVQAFMLKRTIEASLGHAAAIVTDVIEHAETSQLITASQKRALIQEMALRLA